MALVADASASPPTQVINRYFSKNRIIAKQLNEMIGDLEREDIISIIFLFTNAKTNISEIIERLENDYTSAFLRVHNEEGWEEKLLEILIITGNINILKKLGYSKHEIDEMKNQFTSSVHSVSAYLNPVIKSLYFLCNELGTKESRKLIAKVNEQLNSPVRVNNHDECLEIYMLQWLEKNYFSIDKDNPKLNDLINALKTAGCLSSLPIGLNFECWKRNDSNFQRSDNSNSLEFENNLSIFSDKSVKNLWDQDHKKLCIIINITNFSAGPFKDKERKGSEQDAKNLKETFEGCGFEIELHKDLSASEIKQLLKNLNEASKYKEYGCIFLCIMSHGKEGLVTFSDDKDISIKTLKEEFYCRNLKNSFKCIILQACQGKKQGIINNLEADGPSEVVADGPSNNPMFYKNSLLFKSTIPDYMSFRDEIEGSWFIQDICHVIREEAPIKILEWTKKVIKSVSLRRGKTKFADKEVVQLPNVDQSIIDEYTIPAYKKKKKSNDSNHFD